MIRLERLRPQGCITDLTFDGWFADELLPSPRAEAEAHLAGCDRCRARHADLAAARVAFLNSMPNFRPRPRRVSVRHWMIAAAALSVAASMVLLVRNAGPGPQPVVQVKGSTGIEYFVQRDGHAQRGDRTLPLHPGDHVRFAYTSERERFLAIYSRDAAGVVSIFFPPEDRAAPVSEGYDALLPTAVELDATLGPETVFALFCDHPFLVAGPRTILSSRGTLVAGSGCRVSRLRWTKEAAP